MDDAWLDYENAQEWDNGDDVPREPGIYAIFLNSMENIPEDWKRELVHEDNLLYIGKAKTGLLRRLRRHFDAKHSTKDTFRCSVGAIMKLNLGLSPQFHSSASNCRQYSFDNEKVLSDWIKNNCTFIYF